MIDGQFQYQHFLGTGSFGVLHPFQPSHWDPPTLRERSRTMFLWCASRGVLTRLEWRWKIRWIKSDARWLNIYLPQKKLGWQWKIPIYSIGNTSSNGGCVHCHVSSRRILFRFTHTTIGVEICVIQPQVVLVRWCERWNRPNGTNNNIELSCIETSSPLSYNCLYCNQNKTYIILCSKLA